MPNNRKRWQPPHPDPHKVRVPNEDRKCAWQGCNFHRYLTFPVCEQHMVAIHEHVQNMEGDAYDRLARFAARTAPAMAEAWKRHDVQASRGDQPGWVYYLLTDGKVKIGYSANITERLRAYTPGHELLAVHPGTPALERSMHQQFAAYRVAGREWFDPADEILEHCRQVVAEYGSPRKFEPGRRVPRPEIVGTRHLPLLRK